MTVSHLIPQSPIHGSEQSFQGLVTPNGMIDSESVVGVKPDYSSVVIVYQVDNFICSCLAECFVDGSPIYLKFMGKDSALPSFPHELACEDFSLVDQATEKFGCGLDFILTDSVKTLELDVSFAEPDSIASSVSGFPTHG